MKKYDIVKILNDNYKKYNIIKDMRGIVMDFNDDFIELLVLNERVQGDYCYLKADVKDVAVELEKLPTDYIIKLIERLPKNYKEKMFLESLPFNEFDGVEIVNDKKYIKYGLKQGYRGFIVENYMINNKVLVDFSNYNLHDCVTIDLKDLKFIN